MSLTPNDEANLRKIAEDLKRFPSCHACYVEGQEHTCMSIRARWLGREILRTIERDEWKTNALWEKPE